MRFSCISLLAAAIPAWAAPSLTVILGQPTAQSVTLNTRADAALEMYFEYSLRSGFYTSRTTPILTTPDPFANGFFLSTVSLTDLLPDNRYYYRIQYRASGSTGPYTPNREASFNTQRLPGSTFSFAVQGDSHPERERNMFDPGLYNQTLAAVAAEHPDFYITSGDDFSVDTLQPPYTAAAVTGRYTLQLPYFNLLGVPLFLVTGNHEETSLANYNLPNDAANSNKVPIWAQNAHNTYYPSPGPNDPVTGSFYTGNTTTLPGIGQLKDYYAWTWGDALFVVIDPYWSSPVQVDTGLGGQNGTTGKASDRWAVTHGDAQYAWLKQTLEQSKAKWKFIFAHHVMGTSRGGVEIADQYEWGGRNPNGVSAFSVNRPSWSMPIHQLMVANKVTIFFQAHDHLFARQQLDGVVYQSLPNPADNTYTAFNADAYTTGNIFPNSGYTKITVGPTAVKVDYIREWLPKDSGPGKVSGAVQFSYTIPDGAVATPVISAVGNAEGPSPVIAPNTWVFIKGSGLAPGNTGRIWQHSDFVNGRMPTQLDGVSVTVNGKPAFVYYVSTNQINALTPPDAMDGPVTVQVTVNGVTSAAFPAQAAPSSPSFFVYDGTPYIAARHADGSLIAPPALYPAAATPAKPGEAIALYANGFGPLSTPIVNGSLTQAGALPATPEVLIGGLPATVQFAGAISPGLYQFNVVIPSALPDGDQNVVALYAGRTTQTGTTITVAK